MIVMRRSRASLTVPLVAAALAVSACGGGSGTTGGGTDSRLAVVAAFYPLEYLAEQVGGDLVAVTSLAAPGAEPHDLELSPSDLRQLAAADLVVYLSGFMPAVDEAVADLPPGRAWDAATAADLDLTIGPDGETDPHFWLDPVRYGAVGAALSSRLGELDAAGSAAYTDAAADLTGRLTALDAEWAQGTAECANRTLVTTHASFGYLAQRYDFSPRAITGATPEDEPTAQELSATAEFVRQNDVRTIYTETLVSADLADTLAAETGATTALLDPIEGLTDASPGADYLEIMRANLASVRTGQPCS